MATTFAFLRPTHVAVVTALVAGGVAAPAVRNGYVEDAHWIIEQRPQLVHPPTALALLLEPYWPRSFGGSLWRPAVMVSYALDRRISPPPGAHWVHAVDVFWAALAAVLLALLAAQLAGPTLGLATGLLFAVHPVHVEATASGVGRAELMAAAGYAACLLCAWRARADKRWLIVLDDLADPADMRGLWPPTVSGGRVLVTSDIPASREVVVDGQNGLLFRMGDVAALAARVLLAGRDEGLRREIGENARQAVRAYDVRRSVAAHLAIVTEVAAQGPSSSS